MAENKTYCATYHVKHGITQGFGIVYDDESVEQREFSAGSIEDVLKIVVDDAEKFAQEYIAAPSGNTTVVLRELCEKNGKVIDVLAEFKNRLPSESFELVKGSFFPDGTHYTTRRSWIEHVLAIGKAPNAEKGQG